MVVEQYNGTVTSSNLHGSMLWLIITTCVGVVLLLYEDFMCGVPIIIKAR